MKRSLYLLLILLVAFSVGIAARADSGEPAGSLVPEDAVFEWFIRFASTEQNVAIRQIVQVNPQTAVVLTSYVPQGRPSWDVAVRLFLVDHTRNGWTVKDHINAIQHARLDDLLMSGRVIQVGAGLSAVHGLLLDERVVQVDITWEDGVRQMAHVGRGTYLGIRPDTEGLQVKVLVARDTSGNALGEYHVQ